MRGNVGFVFTNEDLKEMRDTLESFKVCWSRRNFTHIHTHTHMYIQYTSYKRYR